jgi:glyceraldehyde-3-phosphate dehydrogenase/erythrose-4-phosphate dehydrogenase
VPVIDGSIADMSLNLVKKASAKDINEFLKHHAATTLMACWNIPKNHLYRQIYWEIPIPLS